MLRFQPGGSNRNPHLDRRSPIFEASDLGVWGGEGGGAVRVNHHRLGFYFLFLFNLFRPLRLIHFQTDFPSEGKMCS